jgi:hypothetical protein
MAQIILNDFEEKTLYDILQHDISELKEFHKTIDESDYIFKKNNLDIINALIKIKNQL